MQPSGPMVELIALPDIEGLRALAAHEPGPDAPWYVLIAPKDRDTWLSVIELETPDMFETVSFGEGDATYFEKLAVLFGDPWATVWENFHDTMAEQMRVADAIGPNVTRAIKRTPVEELIEYRDSLEREPVQSGELLLQEILGTKPLQGRN